MGHKVVIRHDGPLPETLPKSWLGMRAELAEPGSELVFEDTGLWDGPPIVARPTGEFEILDGERFEVYRLDI